MDTINWTIKGKDDQAHTEMIKKLVNRKIDMKQLKRYKVFSKDDTKDDKWMFSSILVSTNRERIYIIEMKAM